MEVWCGMIVGFDNDDPSVFDLQRRFAQQSRISQMMLEVLFAIPQTPLYKRLEGEGRLRDLPDVELGYGSRDKCRAAADDDR